MGCQDWDSYFGVGGSRRAVARVSSWHPKVLPCDHLPHKMPHTGKYIVAVVCLRLFLWLRLCGRVLWLSVCDCVCGCASDCVFVVWLWLRLWL